MSLYRSSYNSPIGPLSILCNEHSICNIGISHYNLFFDDIEEGDSDIFIEAKHWLDIYFSGEQPDFTPQIDLRGTNFQKKVWNELLALQYGQTATYGEIAKRAGCRSAQAIGQAIGRNPILIIVPCHRIVAANGKLGGFSVGIERKIWLLKHEKAL